jgi:hypothetical protein
MSNVQTERMYGWYDRVDQPIEQPTFNPSFPGPCLFCGTDTTEEDVRTHSLMPLEAKRSYFYRTHRTCHEAAPDDQRNAIDGVVFDSIAHHGD